MNNNFCHAAVCLWNFRAPRFFLPIRRSLFRAFACVLLLLLTQPTWADKTYTLGAAAVLGAGSVIPGTGLEQTYYLGVFDPAEQIPESFYRVQVRAQASVFNTTRYASGWVPAGLIDTLSSRLDFDSTGGVTSSGSCQDCLFEPGRRQVLFGPEGFREAPANHRLVILMGSTPEVFFDAVNDVLGDLGDVRDQSSGTTLFHDHLLPDLKAVTGHIEKLDKIAKGE
jgi:hypothetical protein